MIRADLDKLPTYFPGVPIGETVKLSSNETSHPPLPSVISAMTEAVRTSNRYPDIVVTELREHIAQHLGVDTEQVAVGTGSSALCQQLAQITCLPGDAVPEIIFPWRSFEAYPIFAHVVGAEPVKVPLTKEHGLDLDAMAAAINENTRLIFVCNPNNPTGTTITNAEFEAFMDKVPDDIIVALDEAYFEYNRAADTPVATEVIRSYDNVVGLRTFSKAYGLAGARVGYAFGPKNLIQALQKVSIPFSVPTVAQEGAKAALAHQDELAERVEETVVQRERMTQAIEELNQVRIPHSEANCLWIATEELQAAGLGEPQAVADELINYGVLIRAFPDGLRITVTTEEETDLLIHAWERLNAK